MEFSFFQIAFESLADELLYANLRDCAFGNVRKVSAEDFIQTLYLSKIYFIKEAEYKVGKDDTSSRLLNWDVVALQYGQRS